MTARAIEAALDLAWARLFALRHPVERTDFQAGHNSGIRQALQAIESLGGMDPAKREADAVSAEHLHREWSKSL